MLVSIGDRIKSGVYRVHSRFSRAVNFTCGEDLASIVTRDVGDGPLNIVIRELDPDGADGLVVFPDSVEIAGCSWAIDSLRVYDSRIACPRPWSRQADINLNFCAKHLARRAPRKSMAFLLVHGIPEECSGFERALMAHLANGAQCVMPRIRREGIQQLAGCGFGLTPSGDDFLAGVATALRVEELAMGVNREKEIEELHRWFDTDNVLSSSFVGVCVQGRATRKVNTFVAELLAGTPDSAMARCDAVAAVGATSGADFLAGFCARLGQVVGQGTCSEITEQLKV